ncbi:hypothetical protein [Williamwhitmania taraxaci]|uniref:HTH domain-containing protein n=1 Tax=Williamwhitmania taraxaci TaxID=1640674 RepID=A0A1G6PJS8_9BACT|nr:hypothetical protein [Williamwhitmania taraxaci]SDC80241.1 hypothetical protein SAMN05216323_105220 [Williamwhitmania taraxaci]
MTINPENLDAIAAFISRVDDLIYRKATGTPSELAEMFDTSERSIYRLIQALKCLNLPIAYCKQQKTYYYTRPGRLRMGFNPEEEGGL